MAKISLIDYVTQFVGSMFDWGQNYFVVHKVDSIIEPFHYSTVDFDFALDFDFDLRLVDMMCTFD